MEREEERNLSTGGVKKKSFIYGFCNRAGCFLCLLGWRRLLISATEATLSRRAVTGPLEEGLPALPFCSSNGLVVCLPGCPMGGSSLIWPCCHCFRALA